MKKSNKLSEFESVTGDSFGKKKCGAWMYFYKNGGQYTGKCRVEAAISCN